MCCYLIVWHPGVAGSATAPAATTGETYNPTLGDPISAAGAPTYAVPTEPVIGAKQAPASAPGAATLAAEPVIVPIVEQVAFAPLAVAAQAPAAETVRVSPGPPDSLSAGRKIALFSLNGLRGEELGFL